MGCVGYVVFVLVLRRLQGMVEEGPFAALQNYSLKILLLFVLFILIYAQVPENHPDQTRG